MLKYVGKRITGIIPTIILISIFVFMFVRLIPGDPARLVAGDEASYETVEMIREELGLNKPVVRQYIDWVSDIFHGDLGNSIKTGKPVTYDIAPVPQHAAPCGHSDSLGRCARPSDRYMGRNAQVQMAGLYGNDAGHSGPSST